MTYKQKNCIAKVIDGLNATIATSHLTTLKTEYSPRSSGFVVEVIINNRFESIALNDKILKSVGIDCTFELKLEYVGTLSGMNIKWDSILETCVS